MHIPTILLSSLLLLPTLSSASSSPPSGPQIETLTPPLSCTRKTHTGDTISVHYRGTLSTPEGEPFDASYDRGTPLTFQLGAGRVIKGWELGLLDMCIGEKRRLTIPPELGYGERSMGPIPAGSTLVFETELVGIKGVESENGGEGGVGAGGDEL